MAGNEGGDKEERRDYGIWGTMDSENFDIKGERQVCAFSSVHFSHSVMSDSL